MGCRGSVDAAQFFGESLECAEDDIGGHYGLGDRIPVVDMCDLVQEIAVVGRLVVISTYILSDLDDNGLAFKGCNYGLSSVLQLSYSFIVAKTSAVVASSMCGLSW